MKLSQEKCFSDWMLAISLFIYFIVFQFLSHCFHLQCDRIDHFKTCWKSTWKVRKVLKIIQKKGHPCPIVMNSLLSIDLAAVCLTVAIRLSPEIIQLIFSFNSNSNSHIGWKENLLHFLVSSYHFHNWTEWNSCRWLFRVVNSTLCLGLRRHALAWTIPLKA